jgi:hypothetical protein
MKTKHSLSDVENGGSFGALASSALVEIQSKATPKYMGAPVAVGYTTGTIPEFIRLPKPGKLCPLTGLSRSKLNELILPVASNDFRPLVKSVSLRKRGQIKAVRLISYDSLRAYLYALLSEQLGHNAC